MGKQRSPGFKLFLAATIGILLIIPLLLIYALVYDRQGQSDTAQAGIADGWAGPQVMVGPVMVIPYTTDSVETVTENGRETSRTVRVKKELFLAPQSNTLATTIKPDRKKFSIYESIVYEAGNRGNATFTLPVDFDRYGISRESLDLNSAELRFGISDSRGLQADSKVTINGSSRELQPGKGLAATSGSGFFTFVDWDATGSLDVSYEFAFRGIKSLSLVPRGGDTRWQVDSSWTSPSFGADYIPDRENVKRDADGFEVSYAIDNLSLGEAIASTVDPAPPPVLTEKSFGRYQSEPGPNSTNESKSIAISLIDPVNIYSQVDRAVKYGFLFIGFTFLAFFMFDVVAGARVAAAEYLLTGVGLVLFFVLLLAFAEVIGFMWAYLVAAGAITGLLTAYSAAVLKSWMRARVIGGLLIGLYAVLYTLLNLEAYSLLIGSLLLFAALAIVMWATRKIEWSSADDGDAPGEIAEEEATATAA